MALFLPSACAEDTRVAWPSVRRARSKWLLAASALGAITSIAPVPAGAVSTPTPHPPANCPVAPELADLAETPDYAIGSLRAVTVEPSGAYPSRNQAVGLSWTGIELDDGCVAVYVRGPGSESFPGQPHARLGPRQDGWSHESIAATGLHCYRLVAIAGAVRGPYAETCAEVQAADSPASSSGDGARWALGLAALGLIGALGLFVIRSSRGE